MSAVTTTDSATTTAATSTSATTTDFTTLFRLKGGWSSAWKISAAFAVLGLAGAGAGYAVAPHRFAFSYLFAFIVAVTIGLGAIFFVLIQHLSTAGWSITVRRSSEFFMTGVFILPILFLPIIPSMHALYPWLEHAGQPAAHGEQGAEHGAVAHGAAEEEAPAAEIEVLPPPDATAWTGNEEALHHDHHQLVEGKSWFLSEGKWYASSFLALALWCLLAWRLFSLSVQQDHTKDVTPTRKLQSFSPGATFIFALSLTLAVFQWVMSLEPSWYSTIYGVYLFAGCAVSAFAIVIVVTNSWRNAGLTGNTINLFHMHDLGKMMFGFIVFWAYIGFSQFMLIWYASIPEETTFFHQRWELSGWRAVSLMLPIAHFALPFLMLLSRNAKRKLPILAFGAGWILVMHVVDIYWLVLPYESATKFAPSWIDFTCLFGVVGAFLTVVFFQMSRYSLVAVGDPRIGRAMRFHGA
ncbi:MAG: hypothetical protein IPK60_00705 [Sandaracinaceae bacterium]|nr:hypothetical protein [Sandaracinaceae bacterium]